MEELKFQSYILMGLYLLVLILYFDLLIDIMRIKFLWFKNTFAVRNLSKRTKIKKFLKKENLASYVWTGIVPFLNIIGYAIMLASIHTNEFDNTDKGELAVDTIAKRRRSLHGYVFKLLGRGR